MTIPTLSRRLPALGAAIAVAFVAGACAGPSVEKANTKSEVVTTSVAGTTGASDAGNRPRTSAPGGSPAGDDTQVLGSGPGQHKASPNNQASVPLRLDIHSVKRLAGGTVEVRFSITNTGDTTKFEPYSQLTDPTIKGGVHYDVGGMALLDRLGDKKYLTLFGSDGVCLCTVKMDDLDLEPGKTVGLYADLAAPPETVSTVDVTLPGFTPVAGLKIQ